MNTNIERRYIPATELRIATGDAGSKERRLTGHATYFNSWSNDLGGFREQIAPGAFRDALAASDIGECAALFNHDPNYVLGRVSAQTLKVYEDERGLAFEINLPDTSYARDLIVSLERGDISQMSFQFGVREDGQKWETRNGTTYRTITRAAWLGDVSPVTFPAYPVTDVALRSLEAWRSATAGAATSIAVPEVEPAPATEAVSSLSGVTGSLELLRLKLKLAEIE